MKWPAIVRFENSDELEIIESEDSWDAFLSTVSADCELILSDGVQCIVSVSSSASASSSNAEGNPRWKVTEEVIAVDAAVELARKHMAAQAHCCVSKFYASTVADVIAALVLLEDQ